VLLTGVSLAAIVSASFGGTDLRRPLGLLADDCHSHVACPDHCQPLHGYGPQHPRTLARMEGPELAHDVVCLPMATGGPVDVVAIKEAVRDWVTHPVFVGLVAAFGGPPVQDDLGHYLAALEEFSAAWDSRDGQERHLAGSLQISGASRDQVLRAADVLGLRDGFARPRASRYDHCLILGGQVRACIVRPAWAAELARTGISFDGVTALGGFRKLVGNEPSLVAELGMADVTDEFHAMDAGLGRAFGAAGHPVSEGYYDPENPNTSWTVHRYEHENPSLSVVAAPSTQPHLRRANTADSYAWWATNIAKLTPGHRVLLVTSAIYVPFQHADAMRMLSAVYGCAVETVGVPAEWTVDGIAKQEFTAANYLQELRSAIRSMRLLVEQFRSA
jgi:hypothetical protein